MVQQGGSDALLRRIAQRVGPEAQEPNRRQQQQQPQGSEEKNELARRRLLASLASNEGMDQEERARHQQFLKAKEEAEWRGGKPAEETTKRSGTRQQVRIGSEVFDHDVGKQLAAIGGSRAQDDEKHAEFLRAKEAAAHARQQEKQREWQASFAEPPAQPNGKAAKSLVPTWISEEQYKEFGYPQIDKKFKDKEWHRQQMELDMTDPRHNPNLNRDCNDPEFWYTAARKPFAKALLRSEQHWESRRKVWLKQYENVSALNNRREEITELLEDCSSEVKRLVTPVMKYAITWIHLDNMLIRAVELKKTFRECLEEKENRLTLEGLRHKIDLGGDETAEAMLREYDARWKGFVDQLTKEKIEEDKQERRVADPQTLAHVMNWATKCKKDGLLEWEQGNWAEAHASWRQADEALRKFKAADDDENKMFMGLHLNVLKNLAQACIKLEFWNDAIECADDAVKIDPDDHKAWFRKACALEGIGRIAEAEECLARVDDCAVGRPDRKRITKDTQARREKLQSIREREAAVNQRMIGKALEKGVFGEDRTQAAVLDSSDHKEEVLPKPKQLESFQEATRKHLTREAAQDLLMDLTEAYQDKTFRLQVAKLSMDVRQDKREFLAHLKKVALPLQKPVLERYGFDPSERGVTEMTRAIQDFTKGRLKDDKVKRAADDTTRALYGPMYDLLTRPDGDPAPAPRLEAPMSGAQGQDSDSD